MIDRQQLKPGDHIYSWRQAYVYAHHGLFVIPFFSHFFFQIFYLFRLILSPISLSFLIRQRGFQIFHVFPFRLFSFACCRQLRAPIYIYFLLGLLGLVGIVRFYCSVLHWESLWDVSWGLFSLPCEL